MDHQAADYDVDEFVGGVEGGGGSFRVCAVGLVGEAACVVDDLRGWVDSDDVSVGGDGLGHHAGEVAGATADVEDAVAGPGTAAGGELGEDVASPSAEENGREAVVAAA